MQPIEPTVTYLELRASTPDGDAAGGIQHKAEGLVLLHVQELAPPGEPRGAVTIVHDVGGHGGQYLALARALAADGWAVALPDLRGNGRSEGERGHSNGIQEVLRDLGDVQDHLAYRQPEAPKVLVGHGMGAIWALAYACERAGDVAALVLAAPLVEPRFELPKEAGGLAKLFKKVGPTTAGKLGWKSGADRDALAHDVITKRAGEQAIEAAQRYRARAGELSIPVFVLCGRDDTLVDAAAAQPLAGARGSFEGIANTAHDVLSAPSAIARTVAWIGGAVPR
ncbi:MAG: alpha/beta fold hydrolase [Planctomycetes bacterium]|nr:alpha/beta fold hydrolase [Planctomycetota bacterium]